MTGQGTITEEYDSNKRINEIKEIQVIIVQSLNNLKQVQGKLIKSLKTLETLKPKVKLEEQSLISEIIIEDIKLNKEICCC